MARRERPRVSGCSTMLAGREISRGYGRKLVFTGLISHAASFLEPGGLLPPCEISADNDTPQQALAPYTTQCVGIDLSKGMVDAYNARALNQVSRASHPPSILPSP